jgi:hypothetical protein
MDRVETRNISIINKSNQIIYYLRSESDSFSISTTSDKINIISKYNMVNKDSTVFVGDKPRNWDNYIEVGCKDGRLRLFIISKDTINKYGWKKVISNNIYTKVYRMNMDDIKKCKWKVIFYGK